MYFRILYRRRHPYILLHSKLISLGHDFRHLTEQQINLLERFQFSLPKEEEDHGERHAEIYRGEINQLGSEIGGREENVLHATKTK